MFLKTVLMIMAGMGSVALPIFVQSETSRIDFAVQATGSFITGTTQNEVDNKKAKSGGVLATYRYFFNKHHGVEMNYGYFLSTEKYRWSTAALGVNTHSHEVSGAYLFRMPLGKFTPFALGGVSALVLDPKNFFGSTQTRAAFVYGAGLNLSRHIFARAEYRGFVYNSPAYDLAAFNGMDLFTHRAERSIASGTGSVVQLSRPAGEALTAGTRNPTELQNGRRMTWRQLQDRIGRLCA